MRYFRKKDVDVNTSVKCKLFVYSNPTVSFTKKNIILDGDVFHISRGKLRLHQQSYNFFVGCEVTLPCSTLRFLLFSSINKKNIKKRVLVNINFSKYLDIISSKVKITDITKYITRWFQ